MNSFILLKHRASSFFRFGFCGWVASFPDSLRRFGIAEAKERIVGDKKAVSFQSQAAKAIPRTCQMEAPPSVKEYNKKLGREQDLATREINLLYT